MKFRLNSLVLLLTWVTIFNASYAQLAQGEWRDHLSYNRCFSIAEMNNTIYCASESSIISYNTESGEVNTHSKTTGLSDVGISIIGNNPTKDKILIAYKNGNIDIIDNDFKLHNISDIKRKSLTGTKTINSVDMTGNYAYLACDFGIVKVDMLNYEINDTYFFGEAGTKIKTNDLCIYNDSIYAATESGIYKAGLKNTNLVDYNFWEKVSFIPQSADEYRFVDSFQDKIYAVYKDQTLGHDKIIRISGKEYNNFNHTYDTSIYYFGAQEEYIKLGGKTENYIYDSLFNTYFEFTDAAIEHLHISNDYIFIASSWTGFTQRSIEEYYRGFVINGPRFNTVQNIENINDEIWVTTGGPDNVYVGGAVYYFQNDKWSSYSGLNNDAIKGLGNTHKIAFDPRDPSHIWISAMRHGILELINKEPEQKILQEDLDLFSRIDPIVDIRIGGMTYDQKNNLWMVMNLINNPVFMIDANGEWTNLELNSSNFKKSGLRYRDMLSTTTGQIWILSQASGIIVVEPDGQGGYYERQFPIKNQFGDILPKAFCLAEDNNGDIWVGTSNGPVIYINPINILHSDYSTEGYQVPIPRNDGTDIVDLLLNNDAILDIKIDGGNRKWLATESSGAFLISEDGEETLLNFREDNSPLFSNSVSGVGVNSEDGEVFFATTYGLLSYKGQATKASTEFKDVYAYPNPVRPDYTGDITIKGLVDKTIVKITDISGNLVYETESLGGQAIWNGKNFNGNRVASGVYLVLLSNQDGSKTHITKILFIH